MDNSDHPDIVDRVFSYWKVRMGKPRARLDAKRRQKIVQRLRDGYTEKDMIDAIDGCALSPFHNGTEQRRHSDRYSMTAVYNDLELILRDAKHVDQFIEIADKQRALDAQRASENARMERELKAAEERHRRRLLDHRLSTSLITWGTNDHQGRWTTACSNSDVSVGRAPRQRQGPDQDQGA